MTSRRIYNDLNAVWSFYDISLDEVLSYNLSKLAAWQASNSIQKHS